MRGRDTEKETPREREGGGEGRGGKQREKIASCQLEIVK
jgi:hypothetical protein